MTKLQRQQKLHDARQRQQERKLAQPQVKVVTPEKPFIPPVDSKQGGFVTSRTLLRDAQGRYIEL